MIGIGVVTIIGNARLMIPVMVLRLIFPAVSERAVGYPNPIAASEGIPAAVAYYRANGLLPIESRALEACTRHRALQLVERQH